jgi:citrate lyase alpha subunit
LQADPALKRRATISRPYATELLLAYGTEVERICGGKPARPKLGERPVAVVKWVDGTVLDTVWQVG